MEFLSCVMRSSSVYPLFKPGASSLGGACLAARVTIQPCSSFTEVSSVIHDCVVHSTLVNEVLLPSAATNLKSPRSFDRSYRTSEFEVSQQLIPCTWFSNALLPILCLAVCTTMLQLLDDCKDDQDISDRHHNLCMVFVSNCIV